MSRDGKCRLCGSTSVSSWEDVCSSCKRKREDEERRKRDDDFCDPGKPLSPCNPSSPIWWD